MKPLKLYVFILILSMSLSVNAQFSGGSGTESDPYIVSSVSDLNEVRNHLDSYFVQSRNLYIGGYDHNNDGKGWMPIAGAGTGTRFTGHYNGQGFVIYNLTINRPNTNNVGLFGHIGVDDNVTDISIHDLGLVNVNVSGARGVGALVGRVTANQHTIIEYTFARGGSVTGDGATGGLVGSNNSHRSTANSDGYKPRISKSFADLDVYWSEKVSGDKFGGIAGCNQKGVIINSYSRGSVNVDNRTAQLSSVERVGGIAGCGLQRSEIYYSYSASLINVPVSNPTVTNVGGVVGTADGNTTVVSAYWDTETSGWNTSPAGEGETTSAMKTQSTFVDYDFVNIWGIDPAINDGYPYLRSDYTDILPVELSHFSLESRENTIELKWVTASELNNDYFTVEKSTDGTEFYPIAEINGAGNSKTRTSYTYNDTELDNGIHYYRLKQTDYDGTSSYSAIKSIRVSQKETYEADVYPNPGNGNITISSKINNTRDFILTDISGKAVFSGTLNAGITRIDISHLPTGTYILKAREIQPKRIIVN
jgi:hypothetical protein